MRGDMLWPSLMWGAMVAALCWWAPPGAQECGDHIPRVGEMVSAPAVKEPVTVRHESTHQERLHVRRDVVTRVGHPVEPIRDEWGGWE